MSRPSSRTLLVQLPLIALCVLAGSLSGCSKNAASKSPEDAGKPKEVNRVVAAEAEGYMSDAMFAIQIKEFDRAEQSIAKAVKLRADIPDWWLQLGILRKKQGKTGDARTAYRKALELHEAAYAKTKNADFIEGQMYILLMLGQEKDARTVLEKALRAHPENKGLKAFSDANGIDQLLRQDPRLKESRL